MLKFIWYMVMFPFYLLGWLCKGICRVVDGFKDKGIRIKSHESDTKDANVCYAVRRTNPWEFGQGVGGRNGTKRHRKSKMQTLEGAKIEMGLSDKDDKPLKKTML